MAGEGAQAQHPAFSQGPPGRSAGGVDRDGASLAIDTYRGRFNMLPEKLGSMVAARDKLACKVVYIAVKSSLQLAAVKSSTPHRVSRVRGKAIHYGCAIPFVAVAAPSLSQLMHGRETLRPERALSPLPAGAQAAGAGSREGNGV